MEKDTQRAHQERLQALIISKELPVAVRDLETLARAVGPWQPIPMVDPGDAVRLRAIHHPVFSTYMDVAHHLWVRPSFRFYREAWIRAGMRLPLANSRQLDHLHARSWAERQGYGYVVLLDVSSGPNMSAGHRERQLGQMAMVGYARNHPVYYAEEVHWAKLWDLNQLKPGEPSKETTGGWDKAPR